LDGRQHHVLDAGHETLILGLALLRILGTVLLDFPQKVIRSRFWDEHSRHCGSRSRSLVHSDDLDVLAAVLKLLCHSF
jgi:hypothetical protein